MRMLGLLLVVTSCSDANTMPPAPPTNLAVSAVGGGAHLVWVDNSDDEDQFVILRKTASTSYGEVGMVPFDTSQYHDGIVIAGTAYTYMITAINAGGEASSNEVQFTP